MRIESRKSGREKQREWLVLLASLSLAGVALAGLHFFGVQLCLLHKLTGVPCPVCGSSRAMLLLLQGRIVDAVILQPLGTFAMLGAGFCTIVYSYFILIRSEVLSLKISTSERSYIFWGAILLIAINWGYLLIRGVA